MNTLDLSKLPSPEVLFLSALDLMLQAEKANVSEDKGKNNAGAQIAKYLAVCGILFPAAWCAACVVFYPLKALANALGLSYNSLTIVPVLFRLRPILQEHYGILPSASCGKIIAYAKEQGRYQPANKVKGAVKPGWLVFFDTETDKSGQYVRRLPRVATHVGMVIQAMPFKTVEGNTSGRNRADGDGIEAKPRSFGRVVGYLTGY